MNIPGTAIRGAGIFLCFRNFGNDAGGQLFPYYDIIISIIYMDRHGYCDGGMICEKDILYSAALPLHFDYRLRKPK